MNLLKEEQNLKEKRKCYQKDVQIMEQEIDCLSNKDTTGSYQRFDLFIKGYQKISKALLFEKKKDFFHGGKG